MKPQSVIFDLDGTLVDTNGAHVDAWHNAFNQLGYDVAKARIIPEVGKGGDKLVPSIIGDEGESETEMRFEKHMARRFSKRRAEPHSRSFPDLRNCWTNFVVAKSQLRSPLPVT